jgi:MOSC domain-containing protein YiiM
MRNTRAVSIVSVEDLDEASRLLGIERLQPEWIGANLVVSGIPRLSFLPRGTHVFLEGKAILLIEDQNAPCRIAGAAIAGHIPGRPDIELTFPKLARRLRGLVGSVEHPGDVHAGSSVTVRLPEQWIYR